MSKPLSREDIIKHKKRAISKTNNLFEEYINSEDENMYKKCSLLAYWLENYTNYIKNEKTFKPTKMKSYKRGDIIKLDLGFNVGSEYGGLHYAIVINNNNPRNSSVLTVIPLTSVKKNKEIHENDVDLGNEIYRSLKLKHDTIMSSLEDSITESKKMRDLSESLLVELTHNLDELKAKSDRTKTRRELDEYEIGLEEAEAKIENIKKIASQSHEKLKDNENMKMRLDKIGDEISRMKKGSVALVEQITTVSKMRIHDPRNSSGVLSGIRLSPEVMNKVNDKIKELFVF